MSSEPAGAKPYTEAEAKQQNPWMRGILWGLLSTTAIVGVAYALKAKGTAADWLLNHGEALLPGVGVGVVGYQLARHHNDNAELIQRLEMAEKRGRLQDELDHRPPPDFLPFKQNDPNLFGRMAMRGIVSGSVGYTTGAMMNFDENNPGGSMRWGVGTALLGAASELTEHLVHAPQHNRRAQILNHFQDKTSFAEREAARPVEGFGLGA